MDGRRRDEKAAQSPPPPRAEEPEVTLGEAPPVVAVAPAQLARSRPQQLLWLQRHAGNQAVARMLAAPARAAAPPALPRRAMARFAVEPVDDFNPWSIVHDLRRAIDQSQVSEWDPERAKKTPTMTDVFSGPAGPTLRKVDAATVTRVLEGLTPEQVARVKRIYKQQENTTLENDLFEGGQSDSKTNLKTDQRARMEVLLEGTAPGEGGAVSDNKLEADAIELHELLAGSLDEGKRERVMALHRRPVAQITAIDGHYERRYGHHPNEDLNKKLEDIQLNRVVQLRNGDWAKADAIVIDLKRRRLDEMQKKLESGERSMLEMQGYENNRRKLIDGITAVLEQNRHEALTDPANAGKDSEAAVSERVTRILSQEYEAWGMTLREQLAVTLKGTQAAGIVTAMEKGDAAETAARRLLEMESRKTTRAVKLAELMRGLRQQADRDVMASIPKLSMPEKEALLADPKGRKRQLVDARAAQYIEDFKTTYENIRGGDGRAFATIVSGSDSENKEMLVALDEGAGLLADIDEIRFAIRKRDAAGIKEVLRRQGKAENVQSLEANYATKFNMPLRKAIFGASGADAAMHPMNMFKPMTTIVRGRDAVHIEELLQTPAEKEVGAEKGVGAEKEVAWIREFGALEVEVTEENSGMMGDLREIGDDPDTQKMMNESAKQLKRLEAAWEGQRGKPELQAAIVREMKKVRATLTGDATAYEEENAQMVEQLRSAVSLVVQIALAFAIPGAGPGIAGFLANTAINIGATVASNMVIYGEQYNLKRFYDDVVGGGMGAIGGKLGEDLAKVVVGKAAKGVSSVATDVGMPATKLGGQLDEAVALGAQASLGVTAVVEAANIAGSTTATTLATGENGFTLDAIIQNVLMNRISDVKETFSRTSAAGGGPPAARPPEGAPPAQPTPEGAVPVPAGGEAQRPVSADGGALPVRDPAAPVDQGPAPAGGSVSPADGTARAPASAAERVEARAMWQHLEQIGSEWTGLPEAGRRARLFANQLLQARAVPAITVVPDKPTAAGNQAEFDFKKWGIRIDPGLINRTPLDAHAVAEMTELIRHETEHALQWWAMARLRASQPGVTADQLAVEMHIDARTATHAVVNVAANPMSQAEMAAAQVLWDSVYSRTSKRNDNLDQRKFYNEQLRRLEAEIADAKAKGEPVDPVKLEQLQGVRNVVAGFDAIYRNLPEEIPAFAKGGAAGDEAHLAQADLERDLAKVPVDEAKKDLKVLEDRIKAVEDAYLEKVVAGTDDPALAAAHDGLLEDHRAHVERLMRAEAELEHATTKHEAAVAWIAGGGSAALQAASGTPLATAAPGGGGGSGTGPRMPGGSTTRAVSPQVREAMKDRVVRLEARMRKAGLEFGDLGVGSFKTVRQQIGTSSDPRAAVAELEQRVNDTIKSLDVQRSQADLEGRMMEHELVPQPWPSPLPAPLPDGTLDREATEAWVRENELDEPLVVGDLIYGALDAFGRPTGLQAVLTPQDAIGGTEAEFTPHGYEGAKATYQGETVMHARGHLLANQLGGSGTDPRNISILYQNGANTPAMLTLENQIRAALDIGDTVVYRVTPIYRGDSPVPIGIHITATGQHIQIDESSVLNRPALVRAEDITKKPPAIRAKTPVVPETAADRVRRARSSR